MRIITEDDILNPQCSVEFRSVHGGVRGIVRDQYHSIILFTSVAGMDRVEPQVNRCVAEFNEKHGRARRTPADIIAGIIERNEKGARQPED
jgi:hypothetical protein